jgi:hypothetical protein
MKEEEEVIVVLPTKIEKFDMAKIKTPNEYVLSNYYHFFGLQFIWQEKKLFSTFIIYCYN